MLQVLPPAPRPLHCLFVRCVAQVAAAGSGQQNIRHHQKAVRQGPERKLVAPTAQERCFVAVRLEAAVPLKVDGVLLTVLPQLFHILSPEPRVMLLPPVELVGDGPEEAVAVAPNHMLLAAEFAHAGIEQASAVHDLLLAGGQTRGSLVLLTHCLGVEVGNGRGFMGGNVQVRWASTLLSLEGQQSIIKVQIEDLLRAVAKAMDAMACPYDGG